MSSRDTVPLHFSTCLIFLLSVVPQTNPTGRGFAFEDGFLPKDSSGSMMAPPLAPIDPAPSPLLTSEEKRRRSVSSRCLAKASLHH